MGDVDSSLLTHTPTPYASLPSTLITNCEREERAGMISRTQVTPDRSWGATKTNKWRKSGFNETVCLPSIIKTRPTCNL
jgi:hypothetical protein